MGKIKQSGFSGGIHLPIHSTSKPMRTVSVDEAQAHLEKLLDELSSNGAIILRRDNGEAYLIRSYRPQSRIPQARVFDLHPGAMEMTDDFEAELPL